jgi:hypothetical protein
MRMPWSAQLLLTCVAMGEQRSALGWLLTVHCAVCVAGSPSAAEATSQSPLSRVLRPLLEQLLESLDHMGRCIVTLSSALQTYEAASASGELPTRGPLAGLAEYVQAILKSEPLVRNRIYRCAYRLHHTCIITGPCL